MEFLVHIEIGRIEGDAEQQKALMNAEKVRAQELAAAGLLKSLWRVPGRRANFGIWVARDADELHAAISSLPLFPFLSVTVHPLAQHPYAPQHMRDGN